MKRYKMECYDLQRLNFPRLLQFINLVSFAVTLRPWSIKQASTYQVRAGTHRVFGPIHVLDAFSRNLLRNTKIFVVLSCRKRRIQLSLGSVEWNIAEATAEVRGQRSQEHLCGDGGHHVEHNQVDGFERWGSIFRSKVACVRLQIYLWFDSQLAMRLDPIRSTYVCVRGRLLLDVVVFVLETCYFSTCIVFVFFFWYWLFRWRLAHTRARSHNHAGVICGFYRFLGFLWVLSVLRVFRVNWWVVASGFWVLRCTSIFLLL
jgi:hypothetical protein